MYVNYNYYFDSSESLPSFVHKRQERQPDGRPLVSVCPLNTDQLLRFLSPEEQEESLLMRPRDSGRPCKFGWTSTGRHIIVIWQEVDSDTVYPVTAYEVPPPR